jgi:hypothetical protein
MTQKTSQTEVVQDNYAHTVVDTTEIRFWDNWQILSSVSSDWPPMWTSEQSSWLQIQSSGFDSWHYQIFWEVVGLERGPLSLVSTVEELLERKSSLSGIESREYGRMDPSRWPRGALYPQKLALTSPTSGGLSVGRARSRTQATEFSFLVRRDYRWGFDW